MPIQFQAPLPNHLTITKLVYNDGFERPTSLLSEQKGWLFETNFLPKEVSMSANTTSVTDATFDKEVLKSSVPVIVDFWAEWCAPCRALSPTLEEVASQYKDKIKVVKLNIDENPDTPIQFGVRSIPTLIVFKAGQQVDQSLGNIPKAQVVSLIQKVI